MLGKRDVSVLRGSSGDYTSKVLEGRMSRRVQ